MGGYVAYYLAKQHPQLIGKVVSLATKFYWDEETAAKEIKMLQPEVMEQKVPALAALLKQRHHPNDWKEVVQKTAGMLIEMGNDNPLKLVDYSTIKQPCLVMLGDKDKMVSLEETVAVLKQLPNGQLCVLPNTKHPIEAVDTELLSYMIKRFIG
jgi:pimeloyl-ACP methyl ester carboxylesterase